jgi:hypothetical protein
VDPDLDPLLLRKPGSAGNRARDLWVRARNSDHRTTEAVETNKTVFSFPNPSVRSMARGFTQPVTEISTRNCFWRVKRLRCVTLTASPPSVRWLCRQCVIINVSQPYRPPRPVTRIMLFLLYVRHIYDLCCFGMPASVV